MGTAPRICSELYGPLGGRICQKRDQKTPKRLGRPVGYPSCTLFTAENGSRAAGRTAPTSSWACLGSGIDRNAGVWDERRVWKLLQVSLGGTEASHLDHSTVLPLLGVVGVGRAGFQWRGFVKGWMPRSDRNDPTCTSRHRQSKRGQSVPDFSSSDTAA